MIAVATLDNGLNLVYGVPVLDKTSTLVLTASRHVLGVLRSLFGGKLPIARVRGVKAKEEAEQEFWQWRGQRSRASWNAAIAAAER